MALFHNANVLARNLRLHHDAAMTAGEIAIFLGLIAAVAGGLGIAFDRRKLLAMTAMFLGWVLAGFFGMLVYGI
jgi:hypothetical protein